MWNEWCIDGPAGYPQGPWASYPGGAELAGTTSAGDGAWLDDAWSLGIAAILGIAAYEGVRRFIGRNDPQGSRGDPPASGPSTYGAGTTPTVPSTATTLAVPAPPEQASPVVADLVDDLLALYDLVPTDALKRRITRVLARAGVEPVDTTAVRFDDQRHDAVGTAPASEALAGTVVEIIQPGFVDANGRILRAAQVVVATDEDGAW